MNLKKTNRTLYESRSVRFGFLDSLLAEKNNLTVNAYN